MGITQFLPGQATNSGGKNSVNDALIPGAPIPGNPNLPGGGAAPVTSTTPHTVTLGAIGNTPIYNIGMPRDAYYFQHSSASAAADTASLPNQLASNGPTTISSMDQLWTKSGGHKGMLVRYVDPSAPATFSGAMPSSFQPSNSTVQRYGFQFHYNPASFQMTYNGVSDVDPYFEAAGADIANPAGGVGMSQSSLALEVFVNRRFDFKYYDPATGRLRSNAPTNLYLPRTPTAAEQVEIYNKGTMYDIEFLIGALVGFKAQSRLRGMTTDLGFLVGYPVELHLSNKMRYFGNVTGITVNHGQFDKRMVPIQSTVDINFSRLPDFG